MSSTLAGSTDSSNEPQESSAPTPAMVLVATEPQDPTPAEGIANAFENPGRIVRLELMARAYRDAGQIQPSNRPEDAVLAELQRQLDVINRCVDGMAREFTRLALPTALLEQRLTARRLTRELEEWIMSVVIQRSSVDFTDHTRRVEFSDPVLQRLRDLWSIGRDLAHGWMDLVPDTKINPFVHGPAAASPSTQSESAACEWVRTGGAWTVTFDGVTNTIPDNRGMGMIRRLLSESGRAVDARELDGTAVTVIREGRGKKIPQGTSRHDVVDRATVQEYRAQLSALAQRLADAEREGDPERVTQLKAEKKHLTKEMQAVATPGGQARAFDDEHEKAGRRVGRAIERAIVAVREYDAVLAEHLDRSIVKRSGRRPMYCPTPTRTWITA